MFEETFSGLREQVMGMGPSAVKVVALLIVSYFLIKIINYAVIKLFDKVNLDRTVETFIENTISVVLCYCHYHRT